MPPLSRLLCRLALGAAVAAGPACAGARAVAPGPAAPAAAAPAYVSRSWVTDDGLPHNVVVRIRQDRAGYLWVATLGGLARFDGQEFTMCAVPGRPATRGRNVRDFALLPDGRVLFLPATGGVLQWQDGAVTPHPVSRLLRGEPLLEIYAAPGGALWFEAGQGLVRWDGTRLQRFGAADGINRRSGHFSWATDSAGRTWIAGADFVGYYAGGRLVRLEAPAGVVYRVARAHAGGVWVYGAGLFTCAGDRLVRVAGPAWPPARASARCLYEDAAGALWIATSREGLFRYADGSFTRIPGVEPGIEWVTGDREGDIWLATDGGGIRRLRPKSFTFVDVPAKTVCTDAQGALWFAAMSGGLVRRAAGATQTYAVKVGHVRLHVMAAAADAAGRIWLGTTSGIFRASAADPRRLTRVDLSVRTAHGLYALPGGAVWVNAARHFGVYRGDRFQPVPLPPGEEVTAFAPQSDPGGGASAGLLIGTSRGQVYQADGAGALRAVPLPAAATHAGAVHAVLHDGTSWWIGAADGLVWTDGTRARRLTAAEGLPASAVLQLLEDRAGELWLATARGLYRVRRDDLLALVSGARSHVDLVDYGPDQGLLGISPITNEQPAACVDARGRLWFCTYKGAIGVDPRRVQRDEVPPPVLVKEVQLDGRRVSAPGALQVPPGEHRLTIKFAALSFAAPERVRLRHKLEGFDAGWIDTAPDRIARYTRLPPGGYRLRVMGSNGDGVWNRRGATLAITVLPAWWQTLWFRIAAVTAFAAFVAAGAGYGSHRRFKARLARLEREHALEQERARIARDMHDELGGSVTGINLAVQRLRITPAATTPALLDVLETRVRRLTIELDRIVWTVSPKHGSLDQLATYVERFARNLLSDSGVRCRCQGHGGMPARPVSPEIQHHVLAVTKEAVNNVLKHAHATQVVIEMDWADGELTMKVRDDGIGFEPEARRYAERNGLQNIAARMAEVGGTFVLESAPGAGTTVTLHVPLAAAVAN